MIVPIRDGNHPSLFEGVPLKPVLIVPIRDGNGDPVNDYDAANKVLIVPIRDGNTLCATLLLSSDLRFDCSYKGWKLIWHNTETDKYEMF